MPTTQQISKIYAGSNLVLEAGSGTALDTLSAMLAGGTEITTDATVTHLPDYAFYRNQSVQIANLNHVVTTGVGWGEMSQIVTVNAPVLYELGDRSLYQRTGFKTLNSPLLEILGVNSIRETGIEVLNLPLARIFKTNCIRGCTLLFSLLIPSAEILETSCALGCPNLEELDLQSALQLQALCLRDTGLVSLTIGTTNCIMDDSNAIQNTPIAQGNGTIWVPDSAVDFYRTAPNWSVFAAQIQPVSLKP